MNIEEFKPGTRLEIEVINSIGDRIGKSYVSQLLDINDNQNITVAAPIWESRLMLIPPNTRIRCVMFDEKKGLYSFTGLIKSREKNENIICLKASIDSEIEKIQRRNYYRLDCSLDVEYTLLKQIEEEKMSFVIVGEPKKAISKNISGNGLSIVTCEEIPEGNFVEVNINLTESINIKGITNVMRSRQLDIHGERKYELGLYLVEISRKDNEILVKYIFDRQRMQLKTIGNV